MRKEATMSNLQPVMLDYLVRQRDSLLHMAETLRGVEGSSPDAALEYVIGQLTYMLLRLQPKNDIEQL